jgi:hypothetical protein
MAKKAKPPANGGDFNTLLAAAQNAVKTSSPFFATKEAMDGLVKHPSGQLVEFNETLKNPTNPNEIAFRATALGMAFNPATPAPSAPPAWGSAPVSAPAQNAPTGSPAVPVAIKKGIPIPSAKRGARATNPYPFDRMEVGDCFDVPPTADNPQPAKRIGSTVSGATKRLAPKTFIMRSVEENGAKLARVWRTA